MTTLPCPEPLDLARERVLLVTLAGIQFAHILDFKVMMPLQSARGTFGYQRIAVDA